MTVNPGSRLAALLLSIIPAILTIIVVLSSSILSVGAAESGKPPLSSNGSEIVSVTAIVEDE